MRASAMVREDGRWASDRVRASNGGGERGDAGGGGKGRRPPGVGSVGGGGGVGPDAGGDGHVPGPGPELGMAAGCRETATKFSC